MLKQRNFRLLLSLLNNIFTSFIFWSWTDDTPSWEGCLNSSFILIAVIRITTQPTNNWNFCENTLVKFSFLDINLVYIFSFLDNIEFSDHSKSILFIFPLKPIYSKQLKTKISFSNNPVHFLQPLHAKEVFIF